MRKIGKIIIPISIIAIFFAFIPKTENAAEIKLKIGDINGDGAIDSRDTLRILEHIAASTIPKIKQNHSDWILTGDKLKAGDINSDGIIDSRDTLRELEYIASSTIPSIAKKHPDWKTFIEKKWVVEVTGIKLDKTTLNIEKGKTNKLVATITPTNASNKVVTWTSSNTKAAIVDGLGNVTAKATGVSIITAKSSNGKTATSKITVNNPVIAATSISLNKTALSLNKGASETLFATITPSNTTNKTVTWSSSNTNILSVANGKITAKSAGSATIIVSTSNGKKAICRVTVKNPVIVATGISLNKTSLSLNIGNTASLFATITPTNTTNKSVTWSSSNKNIVTVSNGKLTAKAAGNATITVKTSNGKVATCKVTVKKVTNPTTPQPASSTGQGSFDLKHAIKVSSKPHAKEHENLKWHGSTVGKHAGMIGAYVEAINILNGKNYTLLEVYNKIISAHPEQKSKNKPVYENNDINNYYNISVSRASANIANVKKALSQGKLVADIANTTNWRNGKGKLWGKTGRHTGLIFYFDGKYYHMKTSVQLNALYTESQLISWLKDTGAKLIIYSKK